MFTNVFSVMKIFKFPSLKSKKTVETKEIAINTDINMYDEIFDDEIEYDTDKLVSETNRCIMLLYEIIRGVDESKLSKHNDSVINMINIIDNLLGRERETFNFLGGNLDTFQVNVSNNRQFISIQTIKEFNIILQNMIVDINNLKRNK